MYKNKTVLQKTALCLAILLLSGMVLIKSTQKVEAKLVGDIELIEAILVAVENSKHIPLPAETVDVEPVEEVVEPEPEPEPEQKELELDPSYYPVANYLAKTVYGEARGLRTTEQAAVIWCILNRTDLRATQTPNDIIAVITAPNQFVGYRVGNPVTTDHYNLSIDVMTRWMSEKNGWVDVGRVLPKEYLYFYGKGGHNHFTTSWRGGTPWNWSLASPYID